MFLLSDEFQKWIIITEDGWLLKPGAPAKIKQEFAAVTRYDDSEEEIDL